MGQEFQAIYEDGVLRLEKPLALPDHAQVRGIVTSVKSEQHPSAKLSDAEFERLMDEFAMSLGGALPVTITRADFYLDHD